MMTPEQMLDFSLQQGPYSLSLSDLQANPHGLDLGPLQAELLPDLLATPTNKISLVPDVLAADMPRVNALLNQPLTPNEILLIGRRELRSNNSWMHNVQRLVKGKARCTLLMHPEDATRHKLVHGQMVTVTSAVGAVTLPLAVSADIMPGVVCMPHGWGHHREGVQLSVAQAHAGVSLNDLTDDTVIDPVTGNAALNGIPVTVSTSG